MSKKIKVYWTETMTRDVEAYMEVDDDFDVNNEEHRDMIYEYIQFEQYDEIGATFIDMDMDACHIKEVKEVKE